MCWRKEKLKDRLRNQAGKSINILKCIINTEKRGNKNKRI